MKNNCTSKAAVGNTLLVICLIFYSVFVFSQNNKGATENAKRSINLLSVLFYTSADTTYGTYKLRLQSILKEDKKIISYEFKEYEASEGKIGSRGFKAKHKYGVNEDYSYKIGTWEFYTVGGKLIETKDFDLREKVIPPKIIPAINNISFPKDTVKVFYLDSLSDKKTCVLLLTKNRNKQECNEFRKIDSFGNWSVLLPEKISGYWLGEVFYRRFRTTYNNKRIIFFAEELVVGKSVLYTYTGEQLDQQPVYLFKKMSESEFNVVQKNLSAKIEYQLSNFPGPSNASSEYNSSSNNILPSISFIAEQPYVDYFQSYLSDCEDVANKFKSHWYIYNDVKKMFSDYNQCK